jgi:hypothetical protein
MEDLIWFLERYVEWNGRVSEGLGGSREVERTSRE